LFAVTSIDIGSCVLQIGFCFKRIPSITETYANERNLLRIFLFCLVKLFHHIGCADWIMLIYLFDVKITSVQAFHWILCINIFCGNHYR